MEKTLFVACETYGKSARAYVSVAGKVVRWYSKITTASQRRLEGLTRKSAYRTWLHVYSVSMCVAIGRK